jgi:hypothetical protein
MTIAGDDPLGLRGDRTFQNAFVRLFFQDMEGGSWSENCRSPADLLDRLPLEILCKIGGERTRHWHARAFHEYILYDKVIQGELTEGQMLELETGAFSLSCLAWLSFSLASVFFTS